MKLEYFLTPYTKDQIKMDQRPKCKTKNYKTQRKTQAEHLMTLNQSSILYDPHPRVMEIKAKINKWDLIKLKSF